MAAVPYVDFPAQFAAERAEILAALETVMAEGMLVGGRQIAALEQALAARCGTAHAVALNSGTDALILTLKALGVGPGHEVVTVPNSFIATAAAVVAVGARPVFVDVLADQTMDPRKLETAIGPRTGAVVPVHLSGHLCDMDAIAAIAVRHGVPVVEDAAQAIGSHIDGRMSGSFGRAGCFSAHPLKNLNAAGDAGFVTTDDDELAARIVRLRNHGLEGRDVVVEWGTVSRMDTMQAAILALRLERLDEVINARRRNAALYRRLLADGPVLLPPEREGVFDTYHTFVIQAERRDALKAWLADRDIQSAIHYPIPIHLQPAARDLGYRAGDFPEAEAQAGRILSLPVHQYLGEDDVANVAEAINAFYRKDA